ncbi:MAG TPA: deoxyguanosinetriphosphate triphosphohydrolase, partial [Acidimicrobiales bacterium]|nr:deoxyguanosinetriphosphate triphosphohydrolase [Acidimicrobiales bacterium]
VVGVRRSRQLDAFITSVLRTIEEHGVIGMQTTEAEALAAFRSFNFERIYLRPDSVDQAERVIELLRALTDWFIARPAALGLDPGSRESEIVASAVQHVSGMTDRYALGLAVEHLGWDSAKLPRGA